MQVLIVGGGSEPSKEILEMYAKKASKIIGVDRGCSYLLKNSIYPDYIVGDFDSINKDDINILENRNIEKHQYNCEKDSTDSDIAIELAIKKEFSEIFLLAMTGSRLDHSFANLGLLNKTNKASIKAYLINDNNKILLIDKNSVIERDENYKYISFLAYCDKVENFSIKNAKYELDNYTLCLGDNRTVSNEFINENIEVSFTSGKVLVIFSKD